MRREVPIAGGLLVLAAIGAAVRGPLERLPDPPPPTRPLPPVDDEAMSLPPLPPETPAEALPDELPGTTWAVPVAWILAALALIVLALFVRRLAERRTLAARTEPVPSAAGIAAPVTQLPDLAEPIAQAQERLRQGGPPSDAVIAAWLALEEGGRERGAERGPTDTPTEFAEHVLTATRADPAAVAVLRERYLAARFGTDRVTPEDLELVSRALDRIEATWSG